MKNYAKVFLSVIILGVLFAGSADKPAYKALKGFEPLVGEWVGEVTINGIYTEYTIQLNLDGKNRLKWQLKNVKQNQKKLPDAPKRLMERK